MPCDLGQFAAASAMTDADAMGRTPLTAMNSVGSPTGDPDLAVLEEVLRGGFEVTERAGLDLGAHARTDVTGFGLLGHRREIPRAGSAEADVSGGAAWAGPTPPARSPGETESTGDQSAAR